MTGVLVIGAAIIHHGRVLAARRTHPPEAAGGWELPGGKVEPGEVPGAAAVREVREELGCDITVTGRLDGESPIRDGYVLRVALASLRSGEPGPVPREHDAVRWLGPEELDDVGWLAADRPFLAQLREILLDGEELPGGNVGGAVRIGKTVRRTTGPWTPSVHALLGHLERHGLPHVPQVLGEDERGREVLTFLPGHVIDVDTELLTEPQLASMARWTRAFHEAVDGFRADGPWRFFGVDHPELLAHNDIAPYNACFRGDELVGIFDWDLAGPSTRLLELAHLAWNGVPLWRPLDPAQAARRLRVIAEAYGGATAREILHAVPVRTQLAIDGIRTAIAKGDEGMRNLAAVGEPARTEVSLADLLPRIPAIDEELS
ncbi:MAG TPA: NUDIX domain-containing protein [Nocardioidaceae bacterium]|nr:NUDIX domain-containing protein [Nocardioidaceae bacterium]